MPELIKYELEVPKESKEVVDVALKLIDHILAKKSLAELAELLPSAIQAADGIDKVDDEFKSKYKSSLFAYLVKEASDRL